MTTTVLDWLLRDPNPHRECDGRPFECCHCPFGEALYVGDPLSEPNPADPGEGWYRCGLAPENNPLSKLGIWGEGPTCTPEQWRKKAVEELDTVTGEAAENARLREVVAVLAGLDQYNEDPPELRSDEALDAFLAANPLTPE